MQAKRFGPIMIAWLFNSILICRLLGPPEGGAAAAAAAQVCPSPAYLLSGFTCLAALELKDAAALRGLCVFLPVGAGLGRRAFP